MLFVILYIVLNVIVGYECFVKNVYFIFYVLILRIFVIKIYLFSIILFFILINYLLLK